MFLQTPEESNKPKKTCTMNQMHIVMKIFKHKLQNNKILKENANMRLILTIRTICPQVFPWRASFCWEFSKLHSVNVTWKNLIERIQKENCHHKWSWSFFGVCVCANTTNQCTLWITVATMQWNLFRSNGIFRRKRALEREKQTHELWYQQKLMLATQMHSGRLTENSTIVAILGLNTCLGSNNLQKMQEMIGKEIS